MAKEEVNWPSLFLGDLGTALPTALRHLDTEKALSRLPNSYKSSLPSLAKAVTSTLAQPGGSGPKTLALSALLAALDLRFPPEAEAPLVADQVARAVLALNAGTGGASSPLVAALGLRALCALASASKAHQGSREERQEKQSWARKVVPTLQAALERFPRLAVQQAAAEGCLALCEAQALAGGAALWPLLWPLVVHPNRRVARCAQLALCSVADAVQALQAASEELEQLFAAIRPKLGIPGGAGVAGAQCVRLLEFLQLLLLYGHHSSEGQRRPERAEQVALPLAKLMATISLLLRARQEGALMTEALKLLCVLVEVAGPLTLVFAAQIRGLLELLTEASAAGATEASRLAVFRVILRLEQDAPALVLRKALLERLCKFALDATDLSARSLPATDQKKAPSSRKRKMLRELEELEGGSQEFAAACETLARLAARGAPLLSQSLVAAICERVVEAVWYGCSGDRGGKALDKCLAYRSACQDPKAKLALFHLMEALQRGGSPLAPSLVHAFAALRRKLQETCERNLPASACEELWERSVRARLDLESRSRGPVASGEGIAIVWPGSGLAEPELPSEGVPTLPTLPTLPTPEPEVCETEVEDEKDQEMGQPEEIEEKHTEQAEPTEQEKEQQPAETELAESVPQEEEAKKDQDPAVPAPEVKDPETEPASRAQPEPAASAPPEVFRPESPVAAKSTPALSLDLSGDPMDVEEFSTPQGQGQAEAFLTPLAALEGADLDELEATEPENPMELFSEGSASPALCLDSPSDEA